MKNNFQPSVAARRVKSVFVTAFSVFTLSIALVAALARPDAYAQTPLPGSVASSVGSQLQKYEKESVAVEFSIEPITNNGAASSTRLWSRTDATVRFKIYDTNTRQPLNYGRQHG